MHLRLFFAFGNCKDLAYTTFQAVHYIRCLALSQYQGVLHTRAAASSPPHNQDVAIATISRLSGPRLRRATIQTYHLILFRRLSDRRQSHPQSICGKSYPVLRSRLHGVLFAKPPAEDFPCDVALFVYPGLAESMGRRTRLQRHVSPA